MALDRFRGHIWNKHTKLVTILREKLGDPKYHQPHPPIHPCGQRFWALRNCWVTVFLKYATKIGRPSRGAHRKSTLAPSLGLIINHTYTFDFYSFNSHSQKLKHSIPRLKQQQYCSTDNRSCKILCNFYNSSIHEVVVMVIFTKNFGRLSEVTFLVKAYFFSEFLTIIEPAGQFLLKYLTTEE
mgnify:CR=1 FL=1